MNIWEFLQIGIAMFLILLLLIPILKGAPFLPTHKKTVQQMMQLARIQPHEKVADLGSGDGRLLIAAAELGAFAEGFEINPTLVWWSRRKTRNMCHGSRIKVTLGSFWGKDLSGFDVITVFGIGNIMDDLEKKLLKELKPGARVVSNIFEFPHWQPKEKLGTARLYVKK